MNTRYINKLDTDWQSLVSVLDNKNHYIMHEKLSRNSRIFAVNFAVENFEIFIYDSYDAQIHTKARSILVSSTYRFWLKFIR